MNQQDALFYSQFISIINLYMFWVDLLLIIRRYLSVYSNWYVSRVYVGWLLAGSGWNHGSYYVKAQKKFSRLPGERLHYIFSIQMLLRAINRTVANSMLPASQACAVVETEGVATANSKQYLHNKHKQQNILRLVWKSVRFLQNQNGSAKITIFANTIVSNFMFSPCIFKSVAFIFRSMHPIV